MTPFVSLSSPSPCLLFPPPFLMLSLSRAPSISVLWGSVLGWKRTVRSQQFYLSHRLLFEVTFIHIYPGTSSHQGHTKSSRGSQG